MILCYSLACVIVAVLIVTLLCCKLWQLSTFTLTLPLFIDSLNSIISCSLINRFMLTFHVTN